jgi:hypothetical protein
MFGSIEFNYWKTGGIVKRQLTNTNPSENKSGLICPFDKTEIIRWHDGHERKGYNCPNCETDYIIQYRHNKK